MPGMTVTTKKQLQKLIEDLQKEGEVTCKQTVFILFIAKFSFIDFSEQRQRLIVTLYNMHTVTKYEMECLLKRFRELTSNKLDRSKFRDVLHNEFGLTDDMLMDRG